MISYFCIDFAVILSLMPIIVVNPNTLINNNPYIITIIYLNMVFQFTLQKVLGSLLKRQKWSPMPHTLPKGIEKHFRTIVKLKYWPTSWDQGLVSVIAIVIIYKIKGQICNQEKQKMPRTIERNSSSHIMLLTSRIHTKQNKTDAHFMPLPSPIPCLQYKQIFLWKVQIYEDIFSFVVTSLHSVKWLIEHGMHAIMQG